jgi:mannose-1-phosphate guanylyltransferase
LLNILIMAGGRGERFWPKSRINNPKQLLNLTGNGSMIQETVWRARRLTDPSHIFIVTNAMYAAPIREQLPEIPEENIILEPEGRNTAPCIGLASLFVEAKDPDGVLAVLASDHIIQKPDQFCVILKQGAAVAEQTGGIVTLGITPDRPETGYGYIKMGEALPTGHGVCKVSRFTEKPDFNTAVDFLEHGRYLWNSGMFIWKTATIRQLIAQYMPDLHRGLEVIKNAMHSPDYGRILYEEYVKFEKISIDYGIMERAPEVYVIPADIGWDDVGSWLSLERVRPLDQHGNVFSGPEVTTIDLKDCIFETQGDKLVTAIGLRDLIYVETEDAVLICSKSRASDVKLILEKLKAEKKEKYL